MNFSYRETAHPEGAETKQSNDDSPKASLRGDVRYVLPPSEEILELRRTRRHREHVSKQAAKRSSSMLFEYTLLALLLAIMIYGCFVFAIYLLR